MAFKLRSQGFMQSCGSAPMQSTKQTAAFKDKNPKLYSSIVEADKGPMQSCGSAPMQKPPKSDMKVGKALVVAPLTNGPKVPTIDPTGLSKEKKKKLLEQGYTLKAPTKKKKVKKKKVVFEEKVGKPQVRDSKGNVIN